MADTDCASESASSANDEERVRRLFQACDTDGDGYIDSHDLLTVCRELSLEDSLDELMLQLGADAQGRISYEQFLQRRLALRPEIDAIKSADAHSPVARDTGSENSQGKLDSWEWDSGARDLSPVARIQPVRKTSSFSPGNTMEKMFKERLQQQLSVQSQRYEEQLTELHSVIAELTRKLHQQRAMAITEEDEASDIGTSGHEGSLTCPLDVSELEPTDHDRTYADDLSDTDTKLVMPESPLELPEPKLCGGNKSDTEQSTQLQKEVDMLRAEILSLRSQLESRNENENSLIGGSNVNIVGEKMSPKISNLDSQEDKMSNELYNNEFVKSHIKSSSIIPIHTSCSQNKNIVIEKSQPKLETFKGNTNEKSNDLISENALISQPVAKMAERVRLRRAAGDRPVTGSELAQTGICSTQVAEHLVSDLKCQSELQEHLGTETKTEEHAFETEVCRLNSKIDNLKAQNNILTLTLNECKAHCDRLTLLCGKYESNAVALRVALGFSDRAIEAYDVLLALLETELALDQADQVTLDNRTAAESVALQLLARLDENDVSMILDSPWQRNIYASNNSEGEWSGEHETKLRGHVSYLKAQRNVVEGTCVTLESPHSEQPSLAARHGAASQDMRKLDLETAVLMQELMALREDKAELSAKVYHLEKEKIATDLKLSCLETQLRAQTSTLNNIRGQLNDTEALLAIANQQKDRSSYSDADHAQGIELELIQALARESRLKVRLQELVTTLEQVTKNAEARLLEGRELVADLNQANSTLVQTVDRNHKKYQIRLKKLEQQMISMVERHSVQMQTLKQRIADLEAPANSVSSANSETSL